MEEKKFPTTPLMCCPHCGNPEPVYITEYHKELVARAICRLLNVIMGFLFIFFIGSTVTTIGTTVAEILNSFMKLFGTDIINEATKTIELNSIVFILTLIVCAILKVLLRAYIEYKESKTHIQAICRSCGNLWLLN